MFTKEGNKLSKLSYVRILFLVSLLFVAVINPYSVFKYIGGRPPGKDEFTIEINTDVGSTMLFSFNEVC